MEKRCAWCGDQAEELAAVMVFSDKASIVEYVCPQCRRAWLKKLRKELGITTKKRK